MDDLQKLSASGGTDNFTAGTYKFISLDVATITLTGTVGTATEVARTALAVACHREKSLTFYEKMGIIYTLWKKQII